MAFADNPIMYTDINGSDTSKPEPGTATRAVKHVMNSPNVGPSFGWLYNLLPENKNGDRVVGSIAGVGNAVNGTLEGIKNLITNPVRTFKTAMDLAQVGPPNATQTQFLTESAKQYSENTSAYGTHYANYFFWSKITAEIASITIPAAKAYRSTSPTYSANMAAMDYAVLESMKPGTPSFRVVSAMESNGKITLDVNGPHAPTNLNKNLGLAAASSEKWPLLQCAEPKALNKMLNLGMSKSTISSATFTLRSNYRYRGSSILQYQGGSGSILRPIAPCTNCKILLKGTKNRR